MGTLKFFLSKGLAQGFAPFTSTKKRRTRRLKSRRHRRHHSRRRIMRGG